MFQDGHICNFQNGVHFQRTSCELYDNKNIKLPLVQCRTGQEFLS